jgi:hypothetical protein
MPNPRCCGTPTANPSILVGALRKAKRRNEKRIHLLDWAPDEAVRNRILVDNAAKLYDFSKS